MYVSLRRLPLRWRLLLFAAFLMVIVGLAILVGTIGSLLITGVTSGDLAAGLMGALMLLLLIGSLFVPIPSPQKVLAKETLERLKDHPSRMPTDSLDTPTTWRHVRNFLEKVPSLSVEDWERVSYRYIPPTFTIVGEVRRGLARRGAHAALRRVRRTGRWDLLRAAYGIVRELVIEGTVPSTLRAIEVTLMGCEALIFADLISDKDLMSLYMPFEPFIPAASVRIEHRSGGGGL
jgi:hypothetical protein